MFEKLGLALLLLRELRGLKQAEVARRARVSNSRISKYEGGRELPKLESLERLLGVLDVRQDVFFSVVRFLDNLPEALSAPPGTPVIAMVPSLGSFGPLDEAFSAIVASLLHLQHLTLEVLLTREGSKNSERGRGAAPLGRGGRAKAHPGGYA
jgi:DNA-binding XRE family transcriptional regulator